MGLVRRLILEHDAGEPEVLGFAGGEAGFVSLRCPGKETANEDGVALLELGPTTGLIAIADGMGGARAGGAAARLTLEALMRAGAAADPDDGLSAAVLGAVEAANEHVRDLGVGAASTLVVAEIRAHSVRPFHAGDSHLLLCGQRGRLHKLTVAHSPVGYAVEAGLLDADEALHHDDRHLVSNVVGQADMHLDIGAPIALAPRDTVLLGTDGLFDNLHVPEIVDVVRAGPLERALRELAALARNRMAHGGGAQPSKPDDLTIVAFRPTRHRR